MMRESMSSQYLIFIHQICDKVSTMTQQHIYSTHFSRRVTRHRFKSWKLVYCFSFTEKELHLLGKCFCGIVDIIQHMLFQVLCDRD